MEFFKNFGKREGLVYIVVFLWIIMGLFAIYKGASLSDLAIYFGALTAYVGTYIWGESRRPSLKTPLFKKGPTSRREVMIYVVVFLWAISGFTSIWFMSNLDDLSLYFVSLTGFIMSWMAGEVYKPQDVINKNKDV
jgi:hypothetical protein